MIKKLGAKAIRWARGKHRYPSDFLPYEIEIIQTVLPYTKTSRERLKTLIQSVEYLQKNQVEGAFAECGVWKGGSMMAAALALLHLGIQDRELYLYDTYEGMKDPHEKDIDCKGRKAWDLRKIKEKWSYSSLNEVKENFSEILYNPSKVHFIKGMVEETIPSQTPEKLALLRLDTDWYQSTKHELIHLYPRLSPGGILIIDDYGHWKGARAAVDEYFKEIGTHPYLNRIDYTGRLVIKPLRYYKRHSLN